MIKKIVIKRMSLIFDIKTKWNEMKRDKIEIIPKTNKDRSKKEGTQLKQITNGKATLDFGWPNADFNEMREKRVRRRKNPTSTKQLWSSLYVLPHQLCCHWIFGQHDN